MIQEKRKYNLGLMFFISALVFLTLMAAILISIALAVLLIRTGVIVDLETATLTPEESFLLLAVISLIIGSLVTTVLGGLVMRPVNRLINLTKRLASGDYSARLDLGRFVKASRSLTEVEDSINAMARELESTQMLRSDFVNNFSHEFKTPIVSIAGFAKLLNRGNLTEQQKQEYLAIIEAESLRLSDMATNVLDLTRVENQTILTDVDTYNLSEQLRSCILLLEHKWSKKDLDLDLEFGEYMIRGNEELLKQVWINLLDNAVKFTPDGHAIRVKVEENEKTLQVSVINTGSQIPRDKQGKIFHKFYQADESHATQGNGVGLAIVERITQLHGGAATVHSENDVTAFTVTLPKK